MSDDSFRSSAAGGRHRCTRRYSAISARSAPKTTPSSSRRMPLSRLSVLRGPAAQGEGEAEILNALRERDRHRGPQHADSRHG